MQAVTQWIPLLILVIATAVTIIRDPRRMRCAFLSTLLLAMLLEYLTVDATRWLQASLRTDITYVTLGILLLAFLMVLGVAFFLIWAGIVLLKREGVSLSHSLSLMLGVAILVYLALFSFSVARSLPDLAAFLIFLGLPVLLFSYVLVSFLLYSAMYGFVTKKWGKPGQSTVVLGSGIIGDRVPPLLAKRVDLGIACFEKSWRHWENPALVMSGGQGTDEAVSEGSAMMLYAQHEHSSLARMPENAELIIEDASVNTEQNLLFSNAILEDSGRGGPWTVVTSNFHAFRAANLMSRLGIEGNAVGAATRSYFWASAKLREFAALLVMSKKTTVFFTVVSCLPMLVWVLTRIFG